MKVENRTDWEISSQATQEWAEGSTTRARSPDRTVKPHERAMLTEQDGPCVYILRNLSTGKVYVGSSVRGRRRLVQHRRSLRRNEHFNPYLQAAWNKHGAEDFEFSVHERCTAEKRLEREQWWIDHLGASNPELGYNITHSVVAVMPAPLRSELSKQYWRDLSDEEWQAQSAARKALWDDPDWRAQREVELAAKGAKQRAKRAADPAFNERCLAGLERQRADPEAQARRAAKIKAAWSDPERKVKQSARKKALAADPVYMAAHRERAQKVDKAKLREHNRQQWEDPQIRAKRLEGLAKGRESFWSDPIKRAEQLKKLHAGRDAARAKRVSQ